MPIAEHLRGIVDSLRVQGVGAPIERLLRDDDPDVRATAAIAFADLSPELADAAGQSAYVGLPTDKVLELQRRARRRPPERPTLAELSDDDLVARFGGCRRARKRLPLPRLSRRPSRQGPAKRDRRRGLEHYAAIEGAGAARQAPAAVRQRRSHRSARGGDRLPTCRRAAGGERRSKASHATARYPDNINARAALANWRDKGQIVYGV